MRRLPALCVLAVVAVGSASCTSAATEKIGQPDVGNTIVPDSTTPAPGSCDPLDEQIPAPSVVIGGTSTDLTFGVGAYECSTLTGDGYVINDFNPVLLDASKSVKVKINSDAAPTFTWSLATFTESGDNEWTSAQPTNGCDRLTISLKSPSGGSYATYGADIRVGGQDVACPQRDLDPTDIGAVETIPPGDSIDIPAVSYAPGTDVSATSDSTPGTTARSTPKSTTSTPKTTTSTPKTTTATPTTSTRKTTTATPKATTPKATTPTATNRTTTTTGP